MLKNPAGRRILASVLIIVLILPLIACRKEDAPMTRIDSPREGSTRPGQSALRGKPDSAEGRNAQDAAPQPGRLPLMHRLDR